MQILLTFVLLMIIGAICSIFAKQRGRDPIAWYMLGMLFGLFALLFLFLLPPISLEEGDSLLEKNEDEKLAQLLPTEEYSKKEWFFLDQNRAQHGPVSFDILKENWKEGKLSKHSFIWSEGMPKWEKIGDVVGFESALEPRSDYAFGL